MPNPIQPPLPDGRRLKDRDSDAATSEFAERAHAVGQWPSGLRAVPLLDDLAILPNTRVLLRTDWNIPLRNGTILDLSRIEASYPTLSLLTELGAEITVISHLGYPAGRPAKGLSLLPIAERVLRAYPGLQVRENLRFIRGEESADSHFIKDLVAGQDFFVNDAFSCMHRSHASIIGPPALMPSAAGLLVEREVNAIDRWIEGCSPDTLLVVGGSKARDKLELVAALAPRMGAVAIGGLTALPFLVLLGRAPTALCTDGSLLASAERLLGDPSTQIHVPKDFRVRDHSGAFQIRHWALKAGDTYLDVGPRTAREFGGIARQRGQLLWNGPLGRYEDKYGEAGTRDFLTACGPALTQALVGGGDSVACLLRLGLRHRCGHVSTGGGAMLTYLTRRDLVGLSVLRCRQTRST